jgi:hypothetical protein
MTLGDFLDKHFDALFCLVFMVAVWLFLLGNPFGGGDDQ